MAKVTGVQPWWLHFAGRKPACVEAEGEEEARRLGAELGGSAVTACDPLPYPAEPRLNRAVHQDRDGQEYTTPSFCYRPEQCKGHSACPQRYSCTE